MPPLAIGMGACITFAVMEMLKIRACATRQRPPADAGRNGMMMVTMPRERFNAATRRITDATISRSSFFSSQSSMAS